MTTLAEVIDQAQSETGIDLASVTTREVLAAHLLRFRQRLMARCGRRWKDVNQETVTDVAIVAIGGWGYNFGNNWGGSHTLTLKVAIPDMETNWVVRAHRITEDDWPVVHVVSTHDADALPRPQLWLRHGFVTLLHFSTDWLGIYDALRFQGIPVLTVDDVAEDDPLEPNALLGASFCRCLELEGARFLAIKRDDLSLAGGYAAELKNAQDALFGQVQSHSRLQATRK